jgi:hypothetical protein
VGYRRFVDREGHAWEVRDESRSSWRFAPLAGNPGPPRTVTPPGYENDPFEMSDEEMQRLFDAHPPRTGPSRKPPPFRD